MDDVFFRIRGGQHYLWPAVDRHGQVLDILVQTWRNVRAAKREIMLGVEHRQSRCLNNRAEVSHQPTRRRERQMQRFKSTHHTQRFFSIPSGIHNHFPLRCTVAVLATLESA